MSDKTQTIADKAVEPEDFVAVHIADSFDNQVVSSDTIRTKESVVYFFQVSDVSELSRKPLTFRDANGGKLGPAQPDSGIDYTQLFDDSGTDVLRNDDNEWRLYHVSLGMKQDEGKIYPRIPDNQNGGGWAYLSGSEPDPTDGDDFGAIDAAHLDYDNPTAQLESVVWEQGVRSQVQFGYYNDSNLSIDPVLSVSGQAYETRPVAEQSSKLRLLAELTRDPSQRDVQIATVQYSRTGLRSYSYDTPSEWADATNSLKISEANLPTEIIRALEENGGIE